MARDDVRLQVVATIGAMFAVWTGESAGTAFVVRAYMSGKIGPPREGAGAERALEAEVRV